MKKFFLIVTLSSLSLLANAQGLGQACSGLGVPCGNGCNPGLNCVLCVCAIPALSIELTNFNAVATKSGTKISWITSSENNNAYFVIQRSENNKEFNDIKMVTGKGTTSESHPYDFFDTNIESNKDYYYRLKQIDIDGSYEIFNSVKVSYSDKSFSTQPVLSNNAIKLNITTPKNEIITANVFDLHGRVLLRKEIQVKHGYSTRTLLEQVSSGVIFVEVSNGFDYSKTHKLIIP